MQRPLFLLLRLGLLGALAAGCKENLSPPPPGGLGPERGGPVVRLHPGRDTTVDPTGTLSIRVLASHRVVIRQLALVAEGAPFVFSPVEPNDTAANVFFPVPLAPLAHSSFRYHARAVDVFGYETVTDTVTVVVR